jgi:hypothetical protein
LTNRLTDKKQNQNGSDGLKASNGHLKYQGEMVAAN